MDGEPRQDRFTVYLEGQEGHAGNVLLHAFLQKVHALELTLNKMERAFLAHDRRRTDFEIIDAQKVNPTSLTLRAVPRVQDYSPTEAFAWSMQQIALVAKGEEPDRRVSADIATDLAALATNQTPAGYKRFWVNGFAEKVAFDETFRANAASVAKRRRRVPTTWHVGASLGSVVGELKKVDDIDHDREFVIVPPAGAAAITCTFPDDMRATIGTFLFKTVRVHGTLHYNENSPFPYRVDTREDGIERYPARAARRSLAQMRGAFAGRQPPSAEWDRLIDG